MNWVVVTALLLPGFAFAQACCAGGSALTPGRLQLHEDAAVGLSLKFNDLEGSFDSRRRFLANPRGAHELGFEQDLFATVRAFEHAQFTFLVPFVQTVRWVPSVSDVGGGLGDMNMAARYDFFGAGQHAIIPGIAALAGLTLPSGRPPETSRRPLATDATGAGMFQVNLGLALEQTFGPFVVNLSGLIALRTRREVNGLSSQLGPQLTALAALGYTFENEAALVLSASYAGETDSFINDTRVMNSGRAQTTLALTGTLPLGDAWRLQGGVNCVLPISGLGQNQTAGPGFTVTLIRAWL